MDTKYMINFPPFVCVADIGPFSDTRSYYGHMANSYFSGVNMKQKQNAKFAYDKRFCIDPITLQKKPVQMPGTIGIIPVCATKDINPLLRLLADRPFFGSHHTKLRIFCKISTNVDFSELEANLQSKSCKLIYGS